MGTQWPRSRDLVLGILGLVCVSASWSALLVLRRVLGQSIRDVCFTYMQPLPDSPLRGAPAWRGSVMLLKTGQRDGAPCDFANILT